MAPLLPDTRCFRHVFRRDDGEYRATFCLSRREPQSLEAERDRFLTPREEAVWQTFRFPIRRASHLLGRYCAKSAVALHASLSTLGTFEIEAGVFQQPLVRGGGTQGTQVSLSHSDGWGAAVAFDEGHPMGIDLERIRSDHGSAIRSQLTPEESAMLEASGQPIDDALAVVWTVKEALSKTLRTGLMTPFPVFEVGNATWDSGILSCEFASFGQYGAVGFTVGSFALGIVFPRRSRPVGGPAVIRASFLGLGDAGGVVEGGRS